MTKKWKRLTMTVTTFLVAVCLLLPLAMHAQESLYEGGTAASISDINNPFTDMQFSAAVSDVIIYNISESKGSNSGSALLTVETNTKAEYVWVQYDIDTYAMAMLEDETGTTRTWVTSIRPSTPQVVTVNANTDYKLSGAVSESFKVEMNAKSDDLAPAGSGWASIKRMNTNQSQITSGRSVTLTITTNEHADYVWVDVDNRNVYANLDRESTSQKTWTATVYPDRSQTLTVYANDSDSVEGADTRTSRVTVTQTSSYGYYYGSGSSYNNLYGYYDYYGYPYNYYYWNNYDYYADYFNYYGNYNEFYMTNPNYYHGAYNYYDYYGNPYGYYYGNYYNPYYYNNNQQQWGNVIDFYTVDIASSSVTFQITTNSNVDWVSVYNQQTGKTHYASKANSGYGGTRVWTITITGLASGVNYAFTASPGGSHGYTGNSKTLTVATP